jgi:hypothetical protein
VPSALTLPLGQIVDSINIKALLVEQDAPTIQDVEYVASYNWLEGKAPTILVPGKRPEWNHIDHSLTSWCSMRLTANHIHQQWLTTPNIGSPPAWTPPVGESRLKPDSEDVFRDINAARYPSYPLEPTFRALKVMEPEFDLHTIDIVGCGSTIGNLMKFSGSLSKPFRFDVDVVGDTVLFVRRESSPTEIIQDLQGYGHTFPEAYTTWDSAVRNSCSHQRVVQYEFGGLRFLVRSETDGYLKDARLGISPAAQLEPRNLDDALETISLIPNTADAGKELQVRLRGTKVPQSQIFDVKTRRSNKLFDMEDILPRLWVNHTSKFLIAYHKFGVFENPEVEDVRGEVLAWEENNSNLLARYHAVVKRIVDVVRDSEDKQCEVSWDGEGPLLITKQIGTGRRALPSAVVESFDS